MKPVLKFLREVRTELGNITWPKRDALIQLTFVVISISLLISLILGGFDYLFTQGISLLGQPNNSIQQPAVVVPTISATTSTPTIKLVEPTKK